MVLQEWPDAARRCTARSEPDAAGQLLRFDRRYLVMETRLTLRPGQNGTKKLLARFGERLVCVRYLYDPETGTRHKTVELIIDSAPWRPRARRRRRRDDEIVAVRIEWPEVELRDRAKRLGAVWRPAQKLWVLPWAMVRRLGIEDRVVDDESASKPPR